MQKRRTRSLDDNASLQADGVYLRGRGAQRLHQSGSAAGLTSDRCQTHVRTPDRAGECRCASYIAIYRRLMMTTRHAPLPPLCRFICNQESIFRNSHPDFKLIRQGPDRKTLARSWLISTVALGSRLCPLFPRETFVDVGHLRPVHLEYVHTSSLKFCHKFCHHFILISSYATIRTGNLVRKPLLK